MLTIPWNPVNAVNDFSFPPLPGKDIFPIKSYLKPTQTKPIPTLQQKHLSTTFRSPVPPDPLLRDSQTLPMLKGFSEPSVRGERNSSILQMIWTRPHGNNSQNMASDFILLTQEGSFHYITAPSGARPSSGNY